MKLNNAHLHNSRLMLLTDDLPTLEASQDILIDMQEKVTESSELDEELQDIIELVSIKITQLIKDKWKQ